MSLDSFPVPNPTLGMLLAESRVLSAVAGNACLEGTADELIRQLAIGPEVFRIALFDLEAGGWIFTAAHDGRLTIGRERRFHNAGPPRTIERRRPSSRWEVPEPSFDA